MARDSFGPDGTRLSRCRVPTSNSTRRRRDGPVCSYSSISIFFDVEICSPYEIGWNCRGFTTVNMFWANHHDDTQHSYGSFLGTLCPRVMYLLTV